MGAEANVIWKKSSYIRSKTPQKLSNMSEYAPKSVQDAWDNHFNAFGAQDISRIMLDYDDNSVIRVLKNEDKAIYKGTKEVKTFFETLFSTLPKKTLDSLKAPIINLEENPGMVLLVWKCPDAGYTNCTDTFIFSENWKIKWQNIVCTFEEKTPQKLSNMSEYAPKSVQDAWDNHFNAFGAQDISRIMLDYDDNSVIRVLKNEDKAIYKGTKEVKTFFETLFS